MSEDLFKIPVDNTKKEFLAHLLANSRTILSSKFGDGKSYFLDELKADEEACKEFEFLTLYPVNYQVTNNQDIFELIKRDILFQLMIHEMISQRVIISRNVALSFFIKNKGISLVQDLLPYVAELALSTEESSKVLLAFKGLNLFKDIKEKFKKYKQEYDDDEKIEKFIERIDNSFVYEDDIVTNLIKKTISDYKRQHNKRIVLFIEDLDRIDPAHLFRILNVFSAHMDNCYKFGVKADKTLIGNKFDLDNVVLVVDYRNMRKIFHHFYGEETDFSGYISKFTSSSPFYYSLKEERIAYIIKEVERITGAPEPMIRALIPVDNIQNLSLRKVVNSFQIEKQITRKPFFKLDGKKIFINDTLLKILAVMRRLEMDKDVIDDAIINLLKADQKLFYNYASPFVFLSNQEVHSGLNGTIVLKDEKGYCHRHSIQLDPESGTCTCTTRFANIEQEGTSLRKLCIDIQKYIVK